MTLLAPPAAPTQRLAALPPYVFSWLDGLKAAARARGAQLIDLGIGNPDQPTPAPVVEAVREALADPATHGYPEFRGTARFRQAASDYLRRRFGVAVDPAREVLALGGAKEGLAQLAFAYMEEGAVALVPDIHYPVHARAPRMVGGEVHLMPLRTETGFLPDLEAIPHEVRERARLLLVAYPHNPTGSVATLEFYEEAVAFCARHGLLLVSDVAYVELAHGGAPAPSALQVPGARDVVVEMHSLSKSFNMAGSRIGFAAGNADAVDALFAVRMNMGYGAPAFVQAGAAVALDRAEELVPPVAARYAGRARHAAAAFRALGWPVPEPRATMFLWLRVPEGFTSQGWSEHLISTAGVVVTPGNAFGPGGEGFFRVSLVAEPAVVDAAVERLRAAGVRYR